MKKNPVLWWAALVVGIVGILMQQNVIKISQLSEFWMVVVSAGLFAIASLKK